MTWRDVAILITCGALVFRYEAEAVVFSYLGEPGRKIAEKRLQAAKDADELQSYLLHQ